VVQASRAAAGGEREEVTRLLGRFTFTRSPLLPSHQVALGLRLAGRGDLAGASWYLALVWSNGLFLYLLTAWASTRLYRRGYNRLATGGSIRRRHGGAWRWHTDIWNTHAARIMTFAPFHQWPNPAAPDWKRLLESALQPLERGDPDLIETSGSTELQTKLLVFTHVEGGRHEIIRWRQLRHPAIRVGARCGARAAGSCSPRS